MPHPIFSSMKLLHGGKFERFNLIAMDTFAEMEKTTLRFQYIMLTE